MKWAGLADDIYYVDTYVDETHRAQRTGASKGVGSEVDVEVGVGVGNDRLGTLQVLFEMGRYDGGETGSGASDFHCSEPSEY